MESSHDILFVAEMSSRYHRRRASFLETVGQLMTFITLTSGASAFVVLLGNPNDPAPKILTAIVAAIGTIQALFRVESAAAMHRVWLSKWLEIIREIRCSDLPTESDVQKWNNIRFEIEAECINELRALQVDCFNRTAAAMGLDASPLHIRWYERLTRQLISWDRQYRPLPQRTFSQDHNALPAE